MACSRGARVAILEEVKRSEDFMLSRGTKKLGKVKLSNKHFLLFLYVNVNK